MKASSRPTDGKTGNRSTKKHLLISLLLAFVTFLVFIQVIQSEFINFDDDLIITDNEMVLNGLTKKGLVYAFTTGYGGCWHPLTWISHMVATQLFGLVPGWHHLLNLLLHMANTVLIFLVLSRMTKALWQSAFVAALFALHPLHVESVAWVTERKDVLSTFFWILTIGLYGSYAARPGLNRYLAVLLCFALGLMAKPILVTLPFVLLLLDYWPLGRLEPKTISRKTKHSSLPPKNIEAQPYHNSAKQTIIFKWSLVRPLLIEKIPFFLLTIFASIISYLSQNYAGAVKSFESFPLKARIANAFISYVAYMVKMVWPMNLAILYPHPIWWPSWQVLGSVVLLLVFTILFLKKAKNHRYFIVGWFWYIGTLVPVIGVVQIGAHSMADRFTYIPLIGLFIIIAWGISELLKKWAYRKQAFITFSIISLFCLSLITWRQVGFWQNRFTLFAHTLRVTDRNSIIYITRGLAYKETGKNTEAIIDFNKAIEFNSSDKRAYNYRGIAFSNLGNHQQAFRDYNKAIELDCNYSSAYNNRGIEYGLLGNYQEAIKDFDKAIELDSRYAEAYHNRGIAYHKLGNYQMAIKDVKTAAQLGEKAAQEVLRKQGLNW